MAGKKSGKIWPRAIAFVGAIGVFGGGALAVATVQHVPRVRPHTYLGKHNIAGLTKSEAMTAVKKWFDQASSQVLLLHSQYLNKQPEISAKDLGAVLDAEETYARIPFEGFWDEVGRQMASSEQKDTNVLPSFSFDKAKLTQLGDFIEDNMKEGKPAKAYFRNGAIVRDPEVPGLKMDDAKLSDSVAEAMVTGQLVELAMITAPKKVTDEELAQIKDVMGEYTTRFNNGQTDRSTNIRLAASIIDGTVLEPGETFSFNRYVGRRTAEGGFRRAGVLVNGKKEYDIGGGICQVSTTLYNAAVLSDLKIRARSNHSKPVPYIPIGRDAAVSFPEPDMKFENTTNHPIAISASVIPGAITFRVLGIKVPGKSVSVLQGRVSTMDSSTKYVQDDSLGFGVTRVVESGSSRRSTQTYKVVYQDGKEVKREVLHSSFYPGAQRVIARNTKAVRPAPKAPEGGTGAAPTGTPAGSPTAQPSSPATRPGTKPVQPDSSGLGDL